MSDDNDSGCEERPVLESIVDLAAHLVGAIRRDSQLQKSVIRLLRQIEGAIVPQDEQTPAPVESFDDQTPGDGRNDDVALASNAEVSAPVSAPAPPVPVSVDRTVLQELSQAMLTMKEVPQARAPQPRREELTLEELVHAARIKGRASIWAKERRSLIAAGADYGYEIKPRDRELIEEASQLRDCFLWMIGPKAPLPTKVQEYEVLADSFENLADAAELLVAVTGDEGGERLLDEALLLAAEAQCALREAVSTVAPCVDSTQLGVFHSLKEIAMQRQVFIHRFMRATDTADPLASSRLAERIRDAVDHLEQEQSARQREKQTLGTIRYHTRRIAAGGDERSDWKRIFQALEATVPDLIRPTDVRLRELLAGLLDTIPEDLEVPSSVQAVLEAIDQYLSVQPVAGPAEVEAPTKEVLAARVRLRGTRLVVIGGDPRPYAKQALEAAFQLSEVTWVTSRAHQSTEAFRSIVQSPGVGLVVLAIRWSSHSFGVVRDYCNAAKVPFVRLPAGYSPNQVASEVVSQLSLPLD